MTGHLAGAMKEAAAGLLDAKDAADTLEGVFLPAVAQPAAGVKQGKPRTGAVARNEWRGLLAWAVAQAKAADPDATRARITEKVPAVTDPIAPSPIGKGPIVAEPAASVTLAEAHRVFQSWLGDEYDTDALDAMLAATAVERLDGDPLWLLIISGSGNAKTETVQALNGIGAHVVSTISSEGALLSATAKRDRTKDATGGLLREIGDRGVLVIKDVTSILSMNRDQRASVLGALREVHDGSWVRKAGTDGGRSLPWAGRIAVVGAVTTAWDQAHAVIAAMGDRFVLVRIDSTSGRQAAGRKAIGNTGSEIAMRAELAQAVAGVVAGMSMVGIAVNEDETNRLLTAADLVTLARTGVEYDYRGDVIDAHAPEMPTRFAKELTQIDPGRGRDRHGPIGGAVPGAAVRQGLHAPLRLAIIEDLAEHPWSTTAQVRKRLNKPRATVDRQLQALHMLGVLDVVEEEIEHRGHPSTRWTYSIVPEIDPTALRLNSVPEMSPHAHRHSERTGERETETREVSVGGDISGTESSGLGDTPTLRATPDTLTCSTCPAPLLAPLSKERGTCERCHRDAREAS